MTDDDKQNAADGTESSEEFEGIADRAVRARDGRVERPPPTTVMQLSDILTPEEYEELIGSTNFEEEDLD